MKRYLIILTLYLCAVVPMMAQYYSVNYDKRTVEAMTAAFATEAATEAYYAEQVAKIREHYQAAEVAAAGIFTSKFLDRKALTVYETHVADVTSSATWTGTEKNRRLFNGMAEKGTTYSANGTTVKTGFGHIEELGVNAGQVYLAKHRVGRILKREAEKVAEGKT